MRVFVINRKTFLLICSITLIIVIGGILAFHTIFRTEITFSASKKLPIYSVASEEMKIALTFDVAWEDHDFAEILQVLEEYDAKATFFVTGKWVENYPQHITSLYEKGHDVQNHSYNHPHVASISTEELIEDTTKCHALIKNGLSYESNLYRAPYGEYNDQMLSTLEELGYKTIQWDVDSRDWQQSATVDSIVKNVLDPVKSGSIVLFHVDAKPQHTVEGLKIILKELKIQGYSFVLVSELLIKSDYSIDSNGKMHAANS